MEESIANRDCARPQPLAFISHTGADHEFVHRLVSDLEGDGIDVWVDDVDMHLGDSIPDEVTAAMSAATHFVPVLSSSSVDRRWVRWEINHALDQAPRKGRGFILPCVLDDCELPPALRDTVYADFYRGDYGEEYARLRDRALPAGPIPTATQAGLKRLRLGTPTERVIGLRGMAASRHPMALAAALLALKDRDPAVRAVAAETLASMGDDAAVAPLVRALGDEVPLVREAVTAALGGLDPTRVVSHLTPALHDDDPEVQRAAAEALYRLEGDRFAPGTYHSRVTINVPGGRLCITPVHVSRHGHSVLEERALLCQRDVDACKGCDLQADGGEVVPLSSEELARYRVQPQIGFAPARYQPGSLEADGSGAAKRAVQLTDARADGVSVVLVDDGMDGQLLVTGFPLARPGRWREGPVTSDALQSLVTGVRLQAEQRVYPFVLPYHPGKRDGSPLRRIRPQVGDWPAPVGWVNELWYSPGRDVLCCSVVLTDSEVCTQFRAQRLRYLSPDIAWAGLRVPARGIGLGSPVLRWVAFTHESTTGDLPWEVVT